MKQGKFKRAWNRFLQALRIKPKNIQEVSESIVIPDGTNIYVFYKLGLLASLEKNGDHLVIKSRKVSEVIEDQDGLLGTMQTLIVERDLNILAGFANQLWTNGVDSVDLGELRLLNVSREVGPEIALEFNSSDLTTVSL